MVAAMPSMWRLRLQKEKSKAAWDFSRVGTSYFSSDSESDSDTIRINFEILMLFFFAYDALATNGQSVCNLLLFPVLLLASNFFSIALKIYPRAFDHKLLQRSAM